MGLGRGEKHGDLLHARGNGAVESSAIGNQRRHVHALWALDRLRDFTAIGKLRNPARADKARDLDARESRASQRIDERDLVSGRHQR